MRCIPPSRNCFTAATAPRTCPLPTSLTTGRACAIPSSFPSSCRAGLSQEQKELFEAYCENANAGHALMGEAYFAQGFSLGVRLLLEALHAPRPG